MYINFHVWRQMTDVKFLVLHSNTWKHLTVYKILAQARLKI